jgi:tRNA threonylcarbamoyladenosine biosynthesis protein TsaE
MHTYIVNNQNELNGVAADFVTRFAGQPIVALYGSMGAGKTTFVKAVCDAMKVTDVVNSPSFAIVNEYSVPDGKSVFHFDFYRLKSSTEAFDMGYEDYFYSGNYCFVEWPEKIDGLLPEHHLKVNIEELSDSSRKITVDVI